MVVSGGLPTVTAVDIQPTGTGDTADVTLHLGNGDRTVPYRSATWGGAKLPDNVHIQTICNVSHPDEPNDDIVLGDYREFLLTGRTPRRLPRANCTGQGGIDRTETYNNLPLAPLSPDRTLGGETAQRHQA